MGEERIADLSDEADEILATGVAAIKTARSRKEWLLPSAFRIPNSALANRPWLP